MHYQASNHGMFPPVIKNIIIINVLMLLAKMIFAMRGINLDQVLGLFYFQSSQFNVWQIITHVFMHGDVMHLAFNMIGLWFFGRRLEIIWGPQRFLFFYLVTALGAAFLHFLVIHIQISQILPLLDLSLVEEINRDGYTTLMNNMNWNGNGGKYNLLANIPTVGASGAIFGILGANLILFPNSIVQLLFPPISLKLKYIVTFYGLYELYRGIANHPGDNVAHFAHLGGLIVGIIIVKYWNKTRRDSFF